MWITPSRRTLAAIIVSAVACLLLTGGLPAIAQNATAPAETEELFVYLLRDGKIAAARRPLEVGEDRQVGRATLLALLAGPTEDEEEAGLATGIPDGTELLGLSIDQETEVATVDLSDDLLSPPKSDEPDAETEATLLLARLGQVVYTLTQFPTVGGVRFELAGEPLTDLPILETIQVNPINGPIDLSEPLTRANLEPVTPSVFVERPAVGEPATNPLRVAGTANTFEATFFLQILDGADEILVEEQVTATSGTGTRGTFDVTLDLSAPADGEITLVAFERSARDGGIVNRVEIPLVLGSED